MTEDWIELNLNWIELNFLIYKMLIVLERQYSISTYFSFG